MVTSGRISLRDAVVIKIEDVDRRGKKILLTSTVAGETPTQFWIKKGSEYHADITLEIQ